MRSKVSESLGRWLRATGGPEELTAQETRTWLNVWLQLQRAQEGARISRKSAGPSIERDPISRATRAGRMVFKRKGAAKWIEYEDGTTEDDPKKMAEALFATRERIWFDDDTHINDAQPILSAYMCGRDHNCPTKAPINLPMCGSNPRG